MILFKKLRWKNVLSTGNVFTEIDLNKSNTTLIVGENGAGKSTILDALTFALFNKPFRKINKPQLMNSITEKNLVVEIEFSISNNEYKIIRGIKPGIFEVHKNGSLLNQSADSKDYQEILEKQILKINYKSFCQVVVLGSASFVPFMQLPTGQRREIIEDLLDLQIFTTMNSLLKEKVSTNNKSLLVCENDIELIKEKINLVKEHIIEKKQNNEKIIDEKKSILLDTLKQTEDYMNKIYDIKKNIESLKEKTIDLDNFNKKLKKLTSLKHQIEAKLDILNGEIKFFNEHDNCPTCKQEIDNIFKCETVENKNIEVNEVESGLSLLIEQYNEIESKVKEIMKLNEQLSGLNMQSHILNTKIDSLNSYREQLEKEIKNIKNTNKEDETDKLKQLNSNLEDFSLLFNELQEERKTYGYASAILKDGGIKSKIVKQYIPVINKLINKYLSSMEFMCHFELNEQFEETIKSRFRDKFSYSSFSEGEKMRINLAILFTWRAVSKLRNSINTNLLIMDEVFDSSLDSNGTEEFMKILNQFTKDTNTFIISHKTDQLFEKFESVLKFEKIKNFSRIAV
jgi:DNA repair exonuclease SbcCD ATPase subunit